MSTFFLLLEAAIESSKFVFTFCIKFNLQCNCYYCYCWGKAGEEASTILLWTNVTFLGTLKQCSPLMSKLNQCYLHLGTLNKLWTSYYTTISTIYNFNIMNQCDTIGPILGIVQDLDEAHCCGWESCISYIISLRYHIYY